MSEHNSSDHTSVGLIDIASQVPGLLADAPVIVRGVVTGLLARPTSKTSIGKVFQDRAARLGDKVFLRFGDQQADLPRGQRDRQPLRGRARGARCRPR